MRQRQKQVTGSFERIGRLCPQGKYSHYSPWNGCLFQVSHGNHATKNILEIGTAIGFQLSWWQSMRLNAKITTIDRNPEMIGFAKENFAQFDSRKQITLLEGDAVDVLSTLTESIWFRLYGFCQV